MSFWARSPPFTAENQLSLCLVKVSVEVRCQPNPLPFPLPRVGVSPFLFLSAFQRTFDSCSSDRLLIFRNECASSWGQGTAARGIPVTAGFSLVLPGLSFQSQGCRVLVQRRASGLVDGTANCVATSNGSRCCLMSKLLPQPLRVDGRGLHAAWGAVRGHSFSRHFPGISSRFHLTCLSGRYVNELGRLWVCFHQARAAAAHDRGDPGSGVRL